MDNSPRGAANLPEPAEATTAERIVFASARKLRQATVTVVITQLGILEKAIGEGKFELTAYYRPDPSASEDEAVRSIRGQRGWDLKVRTPLEALPLPSAEDLKFIRYFDPERLFLGGVKKSR